MILSGELWWFTAEGWIAIATIFSGIAVLASGAAIVLAARYAADQFLGEQEARDVRKYLLDDGVWKLKASLDQIFQTVRLNYGQCLHLIRLMRDLPNNHPGAPKLEELPRLYQMDPQDFAFAAISPASRVLGTVDLGRVATSAFAQIYSTNAIFTNEVEQSVRTYYSGGLDLTDEQRGELFERLTEVAKRKYYQAEEFLDLPGWLEDAGLRVQRMRIARFDDIDRVQNDPKIVELREKVRAMAQTLDIRKGEE